MPLTLHVGIEAIGVKAGEAGSVIMAAAQAIVEVDEVSWVTVFCCAQAIREVAFPVEARPRAWTAGATGRVLWYSARPSRALEAFRPVAVPLLNEARRWQEGMWAGALVLLLWPYPADASPLFELRDRSRLRARMAANRVAFISSDVVVALSSGLIMVARGESFLGESCVEDCAPEATLAATGRIGCGLIKRR